MTPIAICPHSFEGAEQQTPNPVLLFGNRGFGHADEESVRIRCRSGAQHGNVIFEHLYRIDQTYRRCIFAAHLGIVADRAEPEDVVQEVFLQLFRKVS